MLWLAMMEVDLVTTETGVLFLTMVDSMVLLKRWWRSLGNQEDDEENNIH